MNYKIEKDIKPPEVNKKGVVKKRNKYPFADMKIGDSFVTVEYSAKDWNRLANAARSWARYQGNGYEFTLGKTEDNKIRIWRTK